MLNDIVLESKQNHAELFLNKNCKDLDQNKSNTSIFFKDALFSPKTRSLVAFSSLIQIE